jgi:SAM-dependent methyltransferase
MRGELAALQQPYPALQCQAAPAEATGLPAGTCQGVTAAQALHWFDRAALRQELLRVLAPGGWLAVIWNERQRAPGFPRRYDDTLLAHCPAYRRLPLGFRLSPWAQAQLYGQAVARYEFPHEQHHDWPGLQQRIASCSYVPPDGTEAHAALMRDMAQLFAAYAQDGRVTLPYIARLYIGRVVEAGP